MPLWATDGDSLVTAQDAVYGLKRPADNEADRTFAAGAVAIAPRLLLTAKHVAQAALASSDGKPVAFHGRDGSIVMATLLYESPVEDIAVFLTSSPLAHSLPLRCEAPVLGEEVTALGFPRGQPWMYLAGRVASSVPYESKEDGAWTVLDIAINPGSSGGPLLDRLGRIVGLPVAAFAIGVPAGFRMEMATQGIGYAVPGASLCDFLAPFAGWTRA